MQSYVYVNYEKKDNNYFKYIHFDKLSKLYNDTFKSALPYDSVGNFDNEYILSSEDKFKIYLCFNDVDLLPFLAPLTLLTKLLLE